MKKNSQVQTQTFGGSCANPSMCDSTKGLICDTGSIFYGSNKCSCSSYYQRFNTTSQKCRIISIFVEINSI